MIVDIIVLSHSILEWGLVAGFIGGSTWVQSQVYTCFLCLFAVNEVYLSQSNVLN